MPDNDYYRGLGKQRAAQPSFLEHNRAIAFEGWEGYSAHFRAAQGLPLLDAQHIQYLRPENLLLQGKQILSSEQQRQVFFSYMWKAIWGHIPPDHRPRPPSQTEYEEACRRVKKCVEQGLPLETPLDAMFLTPNDLRDSRGKPYRETTQ